MSGRRYDRQALPDALRALALVSVLVMNSIGYAIGPWGDQLGIRTPDGSPWAAATQGLVAALLQGKGYAMLSFVFGMALWLAARRRPRAEALQRGVVRHQRMLRLGVLHGVFIYFGDILTLYGLVGRRLLTRLHMPWKAFRRHAFKALVWALIAKGLMMVIILMPPGTDRRSISAMTDNLGNADGLLDFLLLNGSSYVAGQIAAIIVAAPVLYLTMLAGLAAARLRLLTHRRWRRVLRRYLRVAGGLLMPASLAYGWLIATGSPTDASRPWVEALGDLISLPVATVYLAALGLASSGGHARWCQWLSPLGQRTLTLYVGNSLACVALYSGIGLGLPLTTVQVVAVCLGLWGVAWLAALQSGDRRWPLEAWMAHR